MMKISKKCLEAIKGFEGFRAKSYKCPAGVWTIGYGHTKGVRGGQAITESQAETLLEGDILPCENYVNGLRLNLTQGQFDALVDFAFNLGTGNLSKSTLLRKIKVNPQDVAICNEFMRWVYAAGNILPGLQKRRAWEVEQYFGR